MIKHNLFKITCILICILLIIFFHSLMSNIYISRNREEVAGVETVNTNKEENMSESLKENNEETIINPIINSHNPYLGGEPVEQNDIDNEWALFLVDKNNPLDENYCISVPLDNIKGYNNKDFLIDERIIDYLENMIDAANEDNITLSIMSAYRSFEYQQDNFKKNVEDRMSKGMTYTEAYAEVYNIVALPGQSEHNTGLAVDILSEEEYLTMDDGFEKTKTYAWLEENAYKYGFILSYPKDKTDITGFIYEPWHYRFVGIYHAKKIHENNLTLKEYIKNQE